MNILLKANEIVFERNEEKERMMALKLSRASYNYKEDNYLDLVAYIASLNDFQNNVQNEHSKDKKRKNTK